MNIYLANVPGLKLIPAGYVSDVDNAFHYVGDFISNPSLLAPNQSLSLVAVPTEGNPLYLPMISVQNASGGLSTIFADQSIYHGNMLIRLEQQIADTLWDYLVQVHVIVTSDGIFQNFAQIDYNQYVEELKFCRQQVESLNNQYQPTEQQYDQPQQEEQYVEPVQEEQYIEPQPEEQYIPQEEPQVTPEEQPQSEPTVEHSQSIIGFGTQVTQEAEDYNNDMNDDDVVASQTSLDLDFVKGLNIGYIQPTVKEDLISINNVTDEQVAEMAKQVSEHAVDTVYAPPFVPKVFRYNNCVQMTTPSDENVETVLSSIDFETFVELVKKIQERDLEELMHMKRQAYALAMEIDRRLCRGKLPLKELLKLVDNSSPLNLTYDVLYSLMKYYISQESPNGLYDNYFLLPYLLKLEFTLRGISAEEIESNLMFLIISWCIREEELIVTEVADGMGDGESDGEDTFAIDIGDSIVSKGQTLLRDAITRTLLADNVPFMLATTDKLTPLQNMCVSSVYGINVYVNSELNHLLKLRGWSIQLEEYSIKSALLGIPVNTYVIVWCLGQALTDISAITQVEEVGKEKSQQQIDLELQQITAAVSTKDYNTTLSLLKKTPKYSQDLINENPVIYLSEYEMELAKYVCAVVNGKPYCVGAIAEVKNISDFDPQNAIQNKYVFLPISGSYYGELLNNGITVKGCCDTFDDLKYLGNVTDDGKLKHSYYCTKVASGVRGDKSKILLIGTLNAENVNLRNIKEYINKYRNPAGQSDIVYNKVKIIPNALYDENIVNLGYQRIMGII